MSILWWDYQAGGLTAAAEHEKQPSQAFVNAKLVIFVIVLHLKSQQVLRQKLIKIKILVNLL